MTARTTRKTATAAATDAVVKNENLKAATAEQSLEQDQLDHATAQTMAAHLMAAMGFGSGEAQPPAMTKTRAILTLVARIAGYAIGFVGALYLTGYLSAVMMSFGLPTFIAAVIEVFSIVLGMVAAWKLSDTVVDFVARGGVSTSMAKGRAWVKGRFDSFSLTNKQAAAQ